MREKGQLSGREVISLVVMGIVLIIALPVFTTILNSVSSGNIESSLDAIINAFIPLILIAIFFEFLRRFFR